MLKYIKYFCPGFVAIMLMLTYLQGAYFPTIFLLIFSFVIIVGDLFVKDSKIEQFSYPNICLYLWVNH